MQLFVDMDGVLADFDQHYGDVFGTRPSVGSDTVDWAAVAGYPDFFLGIPPMADLPVLWRAIAPLRPIVLTGVPLLVSDAIPNKIAWAKHHLGEDVQVRCCRSAEKARHAQPGDVLIDDWTRYRDLWIAAGGRWVTHRSAGETITELWAMGVLAP